MTALGVGLSDNGARAFATLSYATPRLSGRAVVDAGRGVARS